ncbi:hypothetical protein R3W88_002114 [Solanum pinnatisectum]|uniref:LYR motif containing domain-containing protein n=1 Tax=Solanum pinnatisectum TaxID=50273 RepID=A0AAV9MP13_9SOLN|nr:hypothetical protein R3W88_002114 [Solanum pinnatisectum]
MLPHLTLQITVSSLKLQSNCPQLLEFSPGSKTVCHREMRGGLIWATAEDLAKNRGRVLSLYRQILRSLNSPALPFSLAVRLQKKAEVRAMFMLGSEEQSLHNIQDLIDAAEYSLSILRKGEIP